MIRKRAKPAAPDARSAFYAAALSEADRAGLDAARSLDGLAEEIALLRLRLREALSVHPDDARLIEGGVRLLVQSLLAQHRLTPRQANDLGEAVANVLEEFGEVMRGATDV